MKCKRLATKNSIQKFGLGNGWKCIFNSKPRRRKETPRTDTTLQITRLEKLIRRSASMRGALTNMKLTCSAFPFLCTGGMSEFATAGFVCWMGEVSLEVWLGGGCISHAHSGFQHACGRIK